MLMLIRQLAAIIALPFTVAIVIPVWIVRRNHVAWSAPGSSADVILLLGGVVVLLIGLTLFVASVYYFWSRGRGTLAPWDPPRRFVVEGPYRFVRNPMISGVIFVLLGESCALRSWPHAQWAGLFALINFLYIPAVEEPMLAARFGDPYLRYKRAVRRFLPRLRPWNPEGDQT
jgi:protein-S-isoprenylcysteine O-methyltransferase Ste14